MSFSIFTLEARGGWQISVSHFNNSAGRSAINVATKTRKESCVDEDWAGCCLDKRHWISNASQQQISQSTKIDTIQQSTKIQSAQNSKQKNFWRHNKMLIYTFYNATKDKSAKGSNTKTVKLCIAKQRIKCVCASVALPLLV